MSTQAGPAILRPQVFTQLKKSRPHSRSSVANRRRRGLQPPHQQQSTDQAVRDDRAARPPGLANLEPGRLRLAQESQNQKSESRSRTEQTCEQSGDCRSGQRIRRWHSGAERNGGTIRCEPAAIAPSQQSRSFAHSNLSRWLFASSAGESSSRCFAFPMKHPVQHGQHEERQQRGGNDAADHHGR